MIKTVLYIAVFLVMFRLPAQEPSRITREIEINELLKGTLFSLEDTAEKRNLVILIAGSGSTDRYGNIVPGGQNNSLRFLAEGLVSTDYDVFSFDKRIFALAKSGQLDESTLRFDDFIADVRDIMDYFRKDYDKIVLAGHSEGSLVGMVAAQEHADAFISLAGPGRRIDRVMEEQIAAAMPLLDTVQTRKYFTLLRKGETFVLDNPAYMVFFRESVQPYMISWIRYDPCEEIKKLSIPVLILNGTQDIQVKTSEAYLLKEANPTAGLAIIENMNHILKEVKGNRPENLATYNNPDLPVMPELLEKIRDFLKNTP